jgi:hypothetical protein
METLQELLWRSFRATMLREEAKLADGCAAMGLDPSRPETIQDQVRERFGDDMELVREVSPPQWSEGPDFTVRWESRLRVQQRGPLMYAGPLIELSDDAQDRAP